jgi:helicase-like protein
LRDGHLAPCRVVTAPQYRGNPAAAYLALGARRPGILFAPSIRACNAAVAALVAAGVRAAAITAGTTERHRAWAFEAFDRGELDVLASPMALSEGFDSPRAAVCILDRSCAHVGVYLQTAGRVLRPHPSKTGATPGLLLDLRGASARHGSPTDDRVYSLDGTPIASAVAAPAPRRQLPRVPGAAAAASAPPAPRQRPASARRTSQRPASAAGRTGHAIGSVIGSLWRRMFAAA